MNPNSRLTGWFSMAAILAFTGLWCGFASPAQLAARSRKQPIDSFPNDKSAGTWLPVKGASDLPRGDAATANVDEFLKDLHGRMRPLVCWYQGSRLAASRALFDGKLRMPNSNWSVVVNSRPLAASSDGLDISVAISLNAGFARSAGVAVAFDFDGWSPNNYVLVPGVVYDGNRFHALGGGYMPPYPHSMFLNPKLPLTISNDPRLSVYPGTAAKIEMLTGNAATPAICFYSPKLRRAFILLCMQGTRYGDNGLFIEENAAQNKAALVVSAPGVRERAAGFGGFRPSGDTAPDWRAGDRLALKLRLYSFPSQGIPDLLARFMKVRKALTGANQPRNLVPMSTMSETIVPRFKKRWMTTPAGDYYEPENDANFKLGWVGGFMQTPLLAIDDRVERDHICRQLDFVCGKLQGKSGYFYGGMSPEGKILPERSFESRPIVLVRQNADALVAFFRFFRILKAQGHGDRIKPAWERSALRLAEAFAKTWKIHHEFGQYVDPESGQIVVYNSTSGAMVPAGLAMASRYFGDPAFLQEARQSARFYFRSYVVRLGLTCGGCGDISQDPDSESAFGFVESLMELYRAAGDKSWLARASVAADLCATWTLSYDEAFPPASDIGRLDCHMAGAVFASAQNKHAAPGICTSSGDFLFKLYRATGNVRYADLIRDIQHAQVEATEMPGHPTCGMGPGASMERIQPTDAEGKAAIGNFIHTENAWCELDGLLMATELPGIYLQTDSGRLYVFDSVDASIVGRDARGVTVEIHNPTSYDAKVTVFAETSAQAALPIGSADYLGWPHLEVSAGETKTFEITPHSISEISKGSGRTERRASTALRPLHR